MRQQYTMSEYQALPQLSCSALKMILQNPRKFKLWKDGLLNETSHEMEIGTIFHACMLEPDLVNSMYEVREPLSDGLKKYLKVFKEQKYITCPEQVHRNSKVYKAFKSKNIEHPILLPDEVETLSEYTKSGKIFLSQDDVDQINRMVVKTKALPIVEDYIKTGQSEVTLFGNINDVDIKIRVDLLKERENGLVSILDLKTTQRDATAASFIKDSMAGDFYIQNALYMEIARQNFSNVSDFTFLFVSKEDWSGAGFFQHQQIDVETGIEKIKLALSKYKRCQELGYYPESKFEPESEKFQTVSICKLPTYAWYKYLD